MLAGMLMMHGHNGHEKEVVPCVTLANAWLHEMSSWVERLQDQLWSSMERDVDHGVEVVTLRNSLREGGRMPSLCEQIPLRLL